MAHVETYLLRGGRTSSISEGKPTAQRVYFVRFDSKDDGEVRARNAPGVPREGDAHPDDGKMIAKRISAQEQEDPRVFHVTADYETRDEEEEGGGRTAGGLPTIRIGTIHEREVIHKAANGTPIVNSAGQPFLNPPTIRRSNDSITVSGTRTFDAKLPADLRKYRDTINKEALFGYDVGELLLTDRDIKTQRSGRDVVWSLSFTWEVGDHMLRLIDNGLYTNSEEVLRRASEGDPTQGMVLVGIQSGTLKRVHDSDGRPHVSPVLLDGKGGLLGDGKPPVELPFRVRGVESHAAMLDRAGLPKNLADYAEVK